MLATVQGLLCFSFRADLLAQAVLAQMSNPQDMSFDLVHHDRVSNLMTSVFEITPTNTTTALDVSQLRVTMHFTMALSSTVALACTRPTGLLTALAAGVLIRG